MPAPRIQRPQPELKQEMRSVPTEPVAVERSEPEPERRTATEEREKEEAPKTEERPPEPERQPAAATEAEEGADELPVRLEGAPFPYPEYLENIIIQIRRHWRPPAGGRHLRAELAFTIEKDGSIEEMRWIRRSGDPVFDLEARGAIETAGRRGAFGPLPEGYPGDQLRVSFFFDPSRY
jgi:protein TonB